MTKLHFLDYVLITHILVHHGFVCVIFLYKYMHDYCSTCIMNLNATIIDCTYYLLQKLNALYELYV